MFLAVAPTPPSADEKEQRDSFHGLPMPYLTLFSGKGIRSNQARIAVVGVQGLNLGPLIKSSYSPPRVVDRRSCDSDRSSGKALLRCHLRSQPRQRREVICLVLIGELQGHEIKARRLLEAVEQGIDFYSELI